MQTESNLSTRQGDLHNGYASRDGTLHPKNDEVTSISVKISKQRSTLSCSLVEVLDDISCKNTLEDWSKLFKFPSQNIRKDKQSQSCKCTTNPFDSPVQYISAKLEGGNFKGAVIVACLNQTSSTAVDLDRLAAALQKYHDISDHSRILDEANISSLYITSKEIVKALRSFPCGSPGGPDGLRPQHLKSLTSKSAGEGGASLLDALTSFINMALAGKIPGSVCVCFFGATTLSTLITMECGVQAITIGHTLRRLAAKCAINRVQQRMSALLLPYQLGFGAPLGAEAMVNSARIYLTHLQPGQVMLKFQFMNAFGSILRDCVIAAVKEHAPELLPFVNLCYGSPTKLLSDYDVIVSSYGIQHGDPLSSLLFCLATHKLTFNLMSDLKIFYMNIGIIGGRKDDVYSDFNSVKNKARDLGLQLDLDKCGLISPDGMIFEESIHAPQGLHLFDPKDASLLGCPISNDLRNVEVTLGELLHHMKTLGQTCQQLPKHDALCLLRNVFTLPKLMHTIKCTPCFLVKEFLQEFDKLQCSILSDISNATISTGDAAWTQATLPVKYGGLGIKSAVTLAPSAFLASASASYDLIHQILPDHFFDYSYQSFDESLAIWKHGHNTPPPSGRTAHKLKAWEEPHVKASLDSLLNSAIDNSSRLRILSAARKESGAWITSLPSSSLGTRIEDEVVRIAIGLRLGIPLSPPQICFQCLALRDPLGRHGLSCYKNDTWNAEINRVIKTSLESISISTHLKPTYLTLSDGTHPDGVTETSWRYGQPLAWGVTVVDTFSQSQSSLLTGGPGTAANKAEYLLTEKSQQLKFTHCFIPIGVETTGVFGHEAARFFKELGEHMATEAGDPRECHLLRQRLSIAIQDGNAAAILGTKQSVANK